MLRSTILTAIALAFAAPAMAAEPAFVGSGSYEGDKFEYTTRLAEGDKIKIEGKFLNDDRRFRYVLSPSGLVRGDAAGVPVRFFVSRAQRNQILDQLKAVQEPSFAAARTATPAIR